MRFTVGVDAGSVALKLVAFGDGRALAWLQEATRPDMSAQCAGLMDRLLSAPELMGGEAGTGLFLEVMGRALELDLAGMDELALSADSPARISSTCKVLAESEVISLISDGASKAEVAGGIFQGIAGQVGGLVRQIGWSKPVMFDDGPSQSETLRRCVRLYCARRYVGFPDGDDRWISGEKGPHMQRAAGTDAGRRLGKTDRRVLSRQWRR